MQIHGFFGDPAEACPFRAGGIEIAQENLNAKSVDGRWVHAPKRVKGIKLRRLLNHKGTWGQFDDLDIR